MRAHFSMRSTASTSKRLSWALLLSLAYCSKINIWSPRIQILDLARKDDALTGFEGGFIDKVGRHVYFAPHHAGEHAGRLARVSLDKFDSKSVEVLDLTEKDPSLKGFKGGFAKDGYGYLVPHFHKSDAQQHAVPSGKVVRVDLKDFTHDGIKILDLSMRDLSGGFEGGMTDGTYGYLVPHWHHPPHGKVPRIDLRDFHSVSVLDLNATDSDLRGFDGGFVAGRHVYLAPRYNGAPFGKVVRVERVGGPDFAKSSVEVLDLTKADADLKGFSGAFTDGTYGYFVPRYNGEYFGKLARVDLNSFRPEGVEVVDLTKIDPELKGFSGGFAVGDYGYIVPRYSGQEAFGKFVRIDLTDFHGALSVAVVDLPSTDEHLTGFSGGLTDDLFAYLVPCIDNEAESGKVARIDLREDPSTFALIIDLIAILAGLLAMGVMPTILVRRLRGKGRDIPNLIDSRVELIPVQHSMKKPDPPPAVDS